MYDKPTLIKKLTDLYQKSLKTDDYSDIITELNELQISSIVQYYIHHVSGLGIEDNTIIEYIIRILQNIYNNSGDLCPISDDDYDSLYDIYSTSTNSDIVGGDNVTNREISFHRYPDLRGTLDKVHFIRVKDKGKDHRRSIEEWTTSVENRLGRQLHNGEYDVALFPKFDGVSVIFECDANGYVEKALTRGNTKNNEAVVITPFFKLIRFKPCGNGKPFGVKTEVVITYDNFEKLCKKYGEFKSNRSAVSSIINSKESDPKLLKYLTIVPLRYQIYGSDDVVVHPDSLNNFPVLYCAIDNYTALSNNIHSIYEEYSEDSDRRRCYTVCYKGLAT